MTFQTQIHKHIVVLKTLLHKNIQLRYFPYYFSFVLLHWIFQREKLPNENNISSNHLSLTAYVKRTSFGVSKQFHRNQFSWRPNSTVGHILQKLTRVLITQMAHTFPHQKTELSQMRKRMTPRESQTNTFPTQSSMIRQLSEPTGQDAQIALHAQKFAQFKQVYLLGLGALRLVQIHLQFHKGKA